MARSFYCLLSRSYRQCFAVTIIAPVGEMKKAVPKNIGVPLLFIPINGTIDLPPSISSPVPKMNLPFMFQIYDARTSRVEFLS